MAHVASVNVGPTRDVPWGTLKRSAIDKRPVDGSVAIGPLGLEGDDIADTVHHGGVDQAVYVYAAEDLQAWAEELGRELVPGQFGENLTTTGLDVQDSRLGERWRVGTAVLEVCDVRIPCSVFQGFLDEPQWVRRFVARGVPGAYLRVVEPGTVAAGDRVEVLERRPHDLTVAVAFRAQTMERHLLPDLLAEPRISTKIRRRAQSRQRA
ncbi:MOSC domain-containing protein [Aeromicrobium halocynthiae]|uniref:MOSC domain-containing protein n=1 Tax=Aeromicrobium halocynthiae TaxID=560557 RepID=UPI0031D0BE53